MATTFRQRLRDLQDKKRLREDRTWRYLPYDQLADDFGPVASHKPEELGIVLIENAWKPRRRPYHKQKLALILANMRHFALEQAERGVAVLYLHGDAPYRELLAEAMATTGPVTMMEPAERELRMDLKPLIDDGKVTVVPHEGWLSTAEDFQKAVKDPPWRMDAFYRHMRKKTGIMMEDGSPAGGKYSHDGDNRKPWKGKPPAPDVRGFRPDEVTQEVGELIESTFAHHPGKLDLSALPATRTDAHNFWRWARSECMEHFGPYEDAMSVRSTNIFHTRVSALMNLSRLSPKRVVEDVEAMDIPLNSKEGFIRQVIGWREFMRHVHNETDGFRDMPEGFQDLPASSGEAGDGGFGAWRGEAWREDDDETISILGAQVSALGASEPVPPAYWGEKSGLKCLDTVVESVFEEAYSHHITRLMVLSNIATLLDISPRDLADWFWVAYVDAYDWVVEPNVIGMGTFGLGELFVTKPYVSGAAYINRMSDYCGQCAFHPKNTCPISDLYWAFLERHRDQFANNQRMGLMLKNLERRSPEKKERDAAVFRIVSETLAAGEALTPESLAEAVAE